MIIKLPIFKNYGLKNFKSTRLNLIDNIILDTSFDYSSLFLMNEQPNITNTHFRIGDAFLVTEEGIYIYGVLTFRNPYYEN